MTQGQILEPDQLQPSSPSALPPIASLDGVDPPESDIMCRPGFGSTGRCISVLVNHLKVSFESPDVTFYQYTVCCQDSGSLLCHHKLLLLWKIYSLKLSLQAKITSEDCRPIESKSFRVKIIDELFKKHSHELKVKLFAFDGNENVYTVGPLSQKISDFTLILEESIGLR